MRREKKRREKGREVKMEWKQGESDSIKRLAHAHTQTQVFLIQRKVPSWWRMDSHAELG